MNDFRGGTRRSGRRPNVVWKNQEKMEESNMLIGKIIVDKGINKKEVLSTIRKGWNLNETVDVVDLGEEAFVFTFTEMKDKCRLLKGRPWTIDGSLMSIQEWSEFKVLNEVSFDRTPVWVQFHNVPLRILEFEENVWNMGNSVGDLVWYERPKTEGKYTRCFARARVLIDIRRPLTHGFWTARPDGSEIWISVKYERLQSFCYKCSLIGHDSKTCRKEFVINQKGERVYGPWTVTGVERDKEEALIQYDKN
ncbi:uncharacterized protein LOC114725034 [Neltuma alba]|uniref:uncharacterized protein LOC114725034 n=1 Tax=Neltuma alba TaxID=207710 RepID=UPI0010A59CA6|nr:uncharacterized protein LOC114725034 [Prosopis alba]